MKPKCLEKAKNPTLAQTQKKNYEKNPIPASGTQKKTEKSHIVKLQSKVQTSVLGLGVDFVLPLSQQQQQQPHQNIPEGNILEVFNLAKTINKPNKTHPAPSLPSSL